MQPYFFFLLFLFSVVNSNAQFIQSTDTINAPNTIAQVWVKPMYHDSMASSFVIVIPVEVKLHKHLTHAEHVYVLEGAGEMVLGDKKFLVKKGDLIFIPRGTLHSVRVTSISPMKVLSVQAPYFDGKDRVAVQE